MFGSARLYFFVWTHERVQNLNRSCLCVVSLMRDWQTCLTFLDAMRAWQLAIPSPPTKMMPASAARQKTRALSASSVNCQRGSIKQKFRPSCDKKPWNHINGLTLGGPTTSLEAITTWSFETLTFFINNSWLQEGKTMYHYTSQQTHSPHPCLAGSDNHHTEPDGVVCVVGVGVWDDPDPQLSHMEPEMINSLHKKGKHSCTLKL